MKRIYLFPLFLLLITGCEYLSLSQAKKACYRWGLNSDIERGNWDCKLNKSTMEYLLINEYSDDGIYDPKVIKKFK